MRHYKYVTKIDFAWFPVKKKEKTIFLLLKINFDFKFRCYDCGTAELLKVESLYWISDFQFAVLMLKTSRKLPQDSNTCDKILHYPGLIGIFGFWAMAASEIIESSSFSAKTSRTSILVIFRMTLFIVRNPNNTLKRINAFKTFNMANQAGTVIAMNIKQR